MTHLSNINWHWVSDTHFLNYLFFLFICQNSHFKVYFLIFARNSSIKLLPWKMFSHGHFRASLARFISINEILLTHILRIIKYHDPTDKSIVGRPHFSCIVENYHQKSISHTYFTICDLDNVVNNWNFTYIKISNSISPKHNYLVNFICWTIYHICW